MKNTYKYEANSERSRWFFQKFPLISYDILGNGEKQKIKNFFKRFDFRENVRKFGSIYTKWIITENDSPQIIAHKLYGSTHYYFIILMINKMIDPNFDFPMTERELNLYVEKKYGIENKRGFHHWESVDTGDIADLPDGIIVDSLYPHKIDVDNLEYELKLNDEKRHILLLKPEYLDEVLAELETILTSGFQKVK